MKKLFFTPGPSQLYPTVPFHLQKGLEQNIFSISHRGKQFEELFEHITVGLKKMLNITADYRIFFVSSGTEAMERIIQNCVEKESFHFVNGSFSQRFYTTAQELKKVPQKIAVASGSGFVFETVTIPKAAELICITQNETSTGVQIAPTAIQSLKKAYPEKLIAVDIVSSAPYVSLDYSLLDCVFFSVQKGFGLPAGLGIIVVSPAALEKTAYLQKKGIAIGSYHNFQTLLTWAEKKQTPETPSVLHMYLLEQVLADMQATGIRSIRDTTEKKAAMLYTFFDTHKEFSASVVKSEDRSKTVIVASIGDEQAALKAYLSQLGFIVGSGYGKDKDTQIRIANFPAHTIEQVESLLVALSNYSTDALS